MRNDIGRETDKINYKIKSSDKQGGHTNESGTSPIITRQIQIYA